MLIQKGFLKSHTQTRFHWLCYFSGDGDENSSDDDDDYSLSDQEGSDSGGDAVSHMFSCFDRTLFT